MISSGDTTSQAKINRTVALYNMVPNLLWSVLNLTPVVIFCYHYMEVKIVCIFSAISFCVTLLPRKFFDSMQLGKSPAVYKKIGVRLLNRFTQNGDMINGLIRKKFPAYRVVSKRHVSHKKLLQQTYMFEKFHFGMFCFFLLATVFALLDNYVLWAIVFCITNLLYNVYPNLLQQYIRLRIKMVNKRQRITAS